MTTVTNLRLPYSKRANLSFDLVGKEARELFQENELMEEVRFQRVEGTDLMYDCYTVGHMSQRPPTKGFDLDKIVTITELERRLNYLSSGSMKPSLRIIRPDSKRNQYAIFTDREF